MKLMNEARFVERLFSLIKRKATGDINQLAEKLNISARTVHRLITEMKESGLPIKYCKKGKTFYFDEEVNYEFRITVGNEDLLKIKGGSQDFQEKQ
jgi:predicted DNA-binding transcriptional regulator YafY